MSTTRICLWSSPRNVSTAIMYSFAQRSDTKVIDEPLYAHYLRVTGAIHPGRDEIMASMEQDGNKVVSQTILGSYQKPVLFMKQMAHHLTKLDEGFLMKVKNVLLIRNPKQLITSFAQVITNPTMVDIGLEKQYKIYESLEKQGQTPIVIDSGELLKDPESVIKQLCDRLTLNFEKSMLHWQPGARPEDGIWARYWYANVHKSSSFEKQRPQDRELPPHLASLYQQAKGYYEKLQPLSLRP